MTYYYTITIRSFNFSKFYGLIGRCYKCVNFLESTLVEKKIYPFMCSELSLRMLLLSLFGTILFFNSSLTVCEGLEILTR